MLFEISELPILTTIQEEWQTQNYKEMNQTLHTDPIKLRNLTNYNIQKTKSMNEQSQITSSPRETTISSGPKISLSKRDRHVRTPLAANIQWDSGETATSITIPMRSPPLTASRGVQAQGKALSDVRTHSLLPCVGPCPAWRAAQPWTRSRSSRKS